MPPTRSKATLLLWLCALAGGGSLYGQTGVRDAVPPLRPAYSPLIGPGALVAGEQQSQTTHVAVVGAVHSPATYRSRTGLTLNQILSAAGGVSDEASGNAIIVRGGRIHGPFLYRADEGAEGRAQSPDLPLLDGDVVVVRPRRGVRTALYQSLTPGDASNGLRPRVSNAATSELVHVAFVGLLDYPVVLPLRTQQATTDQLLIELLNIPPDVAARAVKLISDGVAGDNPTAITDGTVLLVNPRALPPGGLRPVEPLPPPRDVAPPQAPNSSPEQSDQSTADRPEFDTDTGESHEVSPADALKQTSMAPGGGRLSEPLPGFQPFVVRDQPADRDFIPVTRRNHPTRPVQVTRGGVPVDVTVHPAGAGANSNWHGPSRPTRSRLVPAHALTASVPSTPRTSDMAGIRRPPASPSAVASEHSGDASWSTDSNPLEEEQASVGNRLDLTVIFGTGIAALLCLVASYLWSREERKRRQNEVVDHQKLDSRREDLPRTGETTTGLEALLRNELPLVEELPRIQFPARLHGGVVGQKRLVVDPPHASLPGPHFNLYATRGRKHSEQRIERHLTAALGAASHVQRDLAQPSTNDPSFVRFDVVEPADEPTTGSSSDVSLRASRTRSAAQGELLSRVLQSLREER